MEASRETTKRNQRAAKRRATKQRKLAYGLSGGAEERKSRIRSILGEHSKTLRRLDEMLAESPAGDSTPAIRAERDAR